MAQRRFTVEILGDAKGAKRAVSETESALGGLAVRGRVAAGGLSVIGTGLKGLGVAAAGFAVAGTAALVGFGKSVVTTGLAYQDSLNSMQAVTHSTDAEMAKVAKTARDLGNDLTLPATSAADAANAMVELAKGNLTADQAMQAAKGTLQLAAAAQIDGAEAATIQADALNAFSLTATSAGHVSDVLANAANAATGEIGDFAQGMQASATVAHQFGISLDDTVTALALFANSGIKGSDAGTSLKSALIALAHPSAAAATAFKKLGVHAFDAKGEFVGLSELSDQLAGAQGRMSTQAFNAAAATAFGTDAVRAAAILAKSGADGFNKMADAVGREGGAAQVAQAKTKGLGGAIAGFQSQIETVKIDVFTREAPGLEKFVRLVSDKLPAAADAGLAGLDHLTTFVQRQIPAAKQVVEEFGPAVQTWVTSKLELAGHAVDAVATPALRGLGNVLQGLIPQAEGAGKAVDSGLRAAIDAAGKVAQQFEKDSTSLGQSVGALVGGVGHAANDALPALKVALGAAAGAANVLIQSLSGAVGVLAPFAGDALLAVGAVKALTLATSGFSAAQGAVGKVTAAYGAMADRASFAAGTVTQKLGQAIGKDLNTAAGAGASAMTAARGAFTLLGGAATVAGGAVLALGYAHQQAAQHAAENTAASQRLYDTVRLGGQAADDAQAQIDALSDGLRGTAAAQGPAAGAALRLAEALEAGKTASQHAHDGLSELDKAQATVTRTQNEYLQVVAAGGSTTEEAATAQGKYRQALADQKILQDALTDSTAKSTQTLAEYTDAILNAAGSETALASQELSVKQSSLSLASAAAFAADATAKHGKNSLEAKQATLAYQQAQTTLKGQILGAADAAKNAAIANDKSGSAAHAAAAGAAAQRGELAKLAGGLTPGSPLQQYLRTLIHQLDLAAQSRTASLRVVVHAPGSITVGAGSFKVVAAAAGGEVVGGIPGRDSVPAMLMPGERVLTRQQNAAFKLGRSLAAGPAGGGNSGPTVLEIRSGGSRLDDLLVEILRGAIRRGGGNVQAVLGRN